MQSSSTSSVAQPEAILDWLQKEMDYRPLGSSSKASMPSSDAIRRVCRGNMVPVFEFLLTRVKSEKTANTIRRNILVHGREDNAYGGGAAETTATCGGDRKGNRVGMRKVKPKGRNIGNKNSLEISNRETALQERESAAKEVERLRCSVRHQRKELKARMLEVSREEDDRKRMLDERSNYRHKQVMLEAYDTQCDATARIFTQYHKRLFSYVNRLKDAQQVNADSSAEVVTGFHLDRDKGVVYSTMKYLKPAHDMLFETNRERDIRMACESLAVRMMEKIHNSFPVDEGSGICLNQQFDTTKLGIDVDGDIPDEVQDVILNCLKSPSQLLFAVTSYTRRLESLIAREIENIDVRADAERLRYKDKNNTVLDASTDLGSPLTLQLYGDGNNRLDTSSNGTQYQHIERQKAHVRKFVATEDQLNKAAEARSVYQKLLNRLYGTNDFGRTSLEINSSLRQLELQVWAMERETAGLKASLTTLISEVERLNMLCEEWKEAEDYLNKTWRKIEELDARRLELKSICDALIRANTDVVAFWSQQPLSAREHASNTIIPACSCVANIAISAKDHIEKEVSTFSQCPDNSLYMLPSTPQALLEYMGPNGSTGPEAVTDVEKNAALLTARAAVGDLSTIPTISRISAALQYPTGSEASLASVLKSMEFCLQLRGSEARVLEELSKAINLVHIRKDLIESGHALLNHAYDTQQEHKQTTNQCLDLASEQEEIIAQKWLPELKNQIANAQKLQDDCKYVDGLLDEWWEQPASTVVDWVTVDGKNVIVWHNNVKQLLASYDKELL